MPADHRTASEYRRYLRQEMMPHILCPGCGHGIVLGALLRALAGRGVDPDQVAMVAGIGCSSRLVGYVDFCTLHTTHGRAPAFATGLKLARPELAVIVLTGDGDGLAIGGNHLIHAARRNIGLLCVLFNNQVYGMTGGQLAPTTPSFQRTATTPYGNLEPAFDACRLLTAAGATFVARGMTLAPVPLQDIMAQALAHKGFAFVEVLTECPEYYGRYNRLGTGAEMLLAQGRLPEAVADRLARKTFLPVREEGAGAAAGGQVRPGLAFGILHREERPELTEALRAASGGARG
ncbi:MAG: 2-oxoacid:ferredoxin oxidoreductase subunit beta [Armatimonadetes bacterium]|nr:2-oxoacid:ferredoxin oxidoreductase subunit beta [Armatimonadota bacterium]